MAMKNKALIVVIAIDLILANIASCQDGFCYNVGKMHQHCIDGGSTFVRPRVGKAGPKGEKGESGTDAVVDYGTIQRIVDDAVADATSSLKQSFSELKSIVDINRREIEILAKEANKHRVDCSKVDPSTYKSDNESRGLFEVYISGQLMNVSCDLDTDGGGWTVIQRRMDGSVDFLRNHSEYLNGFGAVDGEFWIGLKKLYIILQSSDRFQLRIDMEDWDRLATYAKYSTFDIGGPADDYILTVSGYSGTAGDSLLPQNGQKFSTKDHDVDADARNCAALYKGAWWYSNCHQSNLNGLYHNGGPHKSFADGINWKTWKGYNYSLKFVEMKIKPIN